jgi:hypothetical protein
MFKLLKCGDYQLTSITPNLEDKAFLFVVLISFAKVVLPAATATPA